MSENFGYIDIILLAIMAGFILLRLRSTLGKGADNMPMKARFTQAQSNEEFIKSAVEDALKWLEGNRLASKEEYREKKSEVETLCKEVISKLSGGMPGGMPEEQTNSGPNIEEVD